MKKTILLIVLAALALLSGFGSSGCSGKKEPIVVAYPPFEATALVWIAQDRQYFRKNGLELALRRYDSGAASLAGVLNGEADVVVGVSEFVAVRTAFRQGKMAILGNADKGEFIYLVGRRDRGIAEVSDLRGKRVGTAFGTAAQFFLGRLIELNGMTIQDVTLVDLRTPAEWVDAVANGDVDAVVTAQPDADTARARLGDNAFFLSAQSGQFVNGLIVSRSDWATTHPELATKFLKSIAQAEEYALRNPSDAKAIVQKGLNLDARYGERVWRQNQFSLTLDLSLVIAMEDEARWMIRNNLTTEKTVPDFTGYIYEEPLKAIRPEAVNIIR